VFAKYSPDITRSQYRPFSEMLWRCRLHPKTFPVLVSANFLPVLPVLTPFSLSRGDTLSSTGSHPMIQHVYV
ncbi:hypothetical protein BMC76_RS27360, partial [Escherichia coli]